MNAYSTYQAQQVQTASQEQILIMLFDGAIRFLNLAKAGLQEGNLEKFSNNLLKAQRIVMEFMSTLDMDAGGDMAKNLFQLYEYLHYRLVQANQKKDASMIDEVQDHLRELKRTWEEAIEIASRQNRSLQDGSGKGHAYSA